MIIMSLTMLMMLLQSCKKEELKIDEDFHGYIAADYNDAIQLQVGNYWVYQFARLDTNGNYEYFGYDSISVEKDSILPRGKKVYQLFENGVPYDLVYDGAVF